MDDPGNPRLAGRVEQHVGIGDRGFERHAAMIEADPVRVVESGYPLEAPGERHRVIEPVGQRPHAVAQQMCSLRVECERPDLAAFVEEPLGDAGSGVAECTGHQIQVGVAYGQGSQGEWARARHRGALYIRPSKGNRAAGSRAP
jgi:hypothetical protein